MAIWFNLSSSINCPVFKACFLQAFFWFSHADMVFDLEKLTKSTFPGTRELNPVYLLPAGHKTHKIQLLYHCILNKPLSEKRVFPLAYR